MSFLEGFAKGFKDVQDKQFTKEMKEEERAYLDKVRAEDRQYQSDAASAKAREDRWMAILQASGGRTRRGTGGGTSKEPNVQAGVDFFNNSFLKKALETATTPEEKASIKALAVQVERDPRIASDLLTHYQNTPRDQYDPIEVANTVELFGVQDAVSELMSMAEIEEASKSREGTEEALGRLRQKQQRPSTVFPKAGEALAEEKQAEAVLTSVVRIAQQAQEGLSPEEYAPIQLDIKRVEEGGAASGAAMTRLYERFGTEVMDLLDDPRYEDSFAGWRNNPFLSFVKEESEAPPPTPEESEVLTFETEEAARNSGLPSGIKIRIRQSDGRYKTATTK